MNEIKTDLRKAIELLKKREESDDVEVVIIFVGREKEGSSAMISGEGIPIVAGLSQLVLEVVEEEPDFGLMILLNIIEMCLLNDGSKLSEEDVMMWRAAILHQLRRMESEDE